MKRIELNIFERCKICNDSKTECESCNRDSRIAWGINEIMDFLEKNVPIKNGKIFHCLNCGHNTGYPGDLDCCSEPNWMVIK
ncbi:hypothetical protein LCGC14_3061010 [marine sediment metagenome]|uniref:Uncharacterized protein n=1 Tax=marine sediment metagenome TaxID=412755 RepID=A0A0F8Z9L7_9ZZZZ